MIRTVEPLSSLSAAPFLSSFFSILLIFDQTFSQKLYGVRWHMNAELPGPQTPRHRHFLTFWSLIAGLRIKLSEIFAELRVIKVCGRTSHSAGDIGGMWVP